MNRLASVLEAADVRVDVAARSRLALFVEAAILFKRHGWLVAPSTVTDALIAREQLASTCLGHGVAIPHARLKGLKKAVAAVIRLKEPLAFGGPDEEPVTLFVFLFVPEMATQSDLELLAEIGKSAGMAARQLENELMHPKGAEVGRFNLVAILLKRL